MLGQTNLILCVIVILIPLTHGITCYVNDLQHKTDKCQYCGFANITANGVVNPYITYNCLPDAQFAIQGIKSTVTNKCEELTTSGNMGYHSFMYVCDKDLCNDSCHNSGSSAQLSYVIAGLLGFVFVVKGQL
uniref:Protein quiver n=1 Tax=Panagrellus redivivus TaxID=6233 RepID=A0A7E4ZUW9_PANRE